MTVAHIGVCVDERTVVVYINRCTGASTRISASLDATIIASLKVPFQYNIDDASRAFCRKLRRGVVYYLNAFDAFGRQLLQNVGTVVGSQSRRLAVNPHLYARVAPQRDVPIVINLYAWNVL